MAAHQATLNSVKFYFQDFRYQLAMVQKNQEIMCQSITQILSSNQAIMTQLQNLVITLQQPDLLPNNNRSSIHL